MPLSRFSDLLNRALSSTLFKNSSFYALNLFSAVVLQLGYFVVISRTFGPSGYGVFATMTAVAMMTAVFVGWGSERVLIQRVAVDPACFPDRFGEALVVHLLTVVPLGALTFWALTYLEHGDLSNTGLACIVIAELFFRRLTMLALCSFFAHERAVKHLVIDIGAHFIRLLFALLATVYSDPLTLDAFAIWYLVGSALAAVIAMAVAIIELGRPRLSFPKQDIRLGFWYSIEMGSVSGLQNLDKPVVVEVLGAAAGGIYIAAFRIITAAASPLRGLLFATYTRYFRQADKGIEHGVAFGLRVLPYVAGISLAVSVCLFVGAGFLPWILGEKFADTVELVRLLALYPLILGAFGVGADLMRAIGLQSLRVLLISISLVAVIPIVYVGALAGGLVGAVLARMAVDVVLAVVSWRIVLKKRADEPQPPAS